MIVEKSSSRVYHIAPLYLRNLGMERYGRGGVGRHRDNAYDGKEEFIHLTREQKEENERVLEGVPIGLDAKDLLISLSYKSGILATLHTIDSLHNNI